MSGTDRNGAGNRRSRALRALLTVAVLGLLAAPSALAARTSASATPAYENVPYGSAEQQYMNIYPSTAAAPASRSFAFSSGAPVVVLVHGGGWHRQSVYTLKKFARESRSLQAAGFTVFSIAYRQDDAETPAFPMEPQDVTAAVNWALAHAASYGGDPNQLVLVGGSAGGHLVAAVAEQLAVSRPGAVKGVVTLSGPFNFAQIKAAFRNGTITSESFKQSVHLALHWWGPYPQALAEEWSPALHAPRANCPPWLIFNSETELIPLAQAREMQSNLTAAGCSATLVVVPGGAHSFEYWSLVEQQIISFIAEH